MLCHNCQTKCNVWATHCEYYACPNCDLLVSKPINTQNYDDAYSDLEPNQFEYTKYEQPHWRTLDKLRCEEIVTHRSFSNDALVLDFGCGTGRFLSVMKELHHDAIGFEVSRGARELAREKKLTVYSEIDDILKKVTGRNVVITMFEVVEHLNDVTFLERICGVAKSVTITGTTGDRSNLVSIMQGKKWPYLMPQHCSIYNKKSMKHMLTAVGFSQVHISNGFGYGRTIRNKINAFKRVPFGTAESKLMLAKNFLNLTSTMFFRGST